jgi:hypothetical protein
MSVLDVVAVVVILLVPFNWATTALMGSLLRRDPSLGTLRSRFVAQVACALAATFGGILAISRLFGWHMPSAESTVLIVLLVLLPSVPSVTWLRSYWSGF